MIFGIDWNRDQLLIMLLAMLPKDGGCKSASELAAATLVSPDLVNDLLSNEWIRGRVGFGNTADGLQGYFAIRQGDALPSSNQPQRGAR